MIIVVAFSMQRFDKNYLEYAYDSPEAKLDKIVAAIKKLYKELYQTNPNAHKIIFSWSELAIFATSSNALDKDFASLLKNIFKKLTEENPKLMVISGAMLIKNNNVTYTHEKREEIISLYTHYSSLFRKKIKEIQDIEIDKFAQQANDTPENTLITQLKNNSYMFTQGKKTKHGKITPYEELIRDKNLKNPVFQLGKGENYSSAITKTDSVIIATEICREHSFHVAQLAAQEKNLEHAIIDLHFILSATNDIETDLMLKNARMVIHIDCYKGVAAYSPSEKRDESILVYEFNLTHGNPNLILIRPLHPLKFKLDNYLTEPHLPSLPDDITNFAAGVHTASLTENQIDTLQTKLCSLIEKHAADNEIKLALCEIVKIVYNYCEETNYYHLIPLKAKIDKALNGPTPIMAKKALC
jgi:hypothetical protein